VFEGQVLLHMLERFIAVLVRAIVVDLVLRPTWGTAHREAVSQAASFQRSLKNLGVDPEGAAHHSP